MSDADRIRELRKAGDLEASIALARERAPLHPQDASLQYEAACIHDRLGFGAQAISYYRACMTGALTDDERQGALIGLGSTLRSRGQPDEALAVFDEGLKRFPASNVLRVFRALALYDLASYRDAVATLLEIVADTSSDPGIREYERALKLYATDLDRRWCAPGNGDSPAGS